MGKTSEINIYSISKIINDLSKLSSLLKKYGFVTRNLVEIYNLDNLISRFQIQNYTKEFDTKDIIFHVSTSGMKNNPIIEELSVTLNLSYTLSEDLSEKKDCFNKYQLEIYIEGNSVNNSKQWFSWHLDREENTSGNYIHPLYHFHAGGNKIIGKNIGDLLMISSPRIPHPPMDIILAIHFIILNFVHAKDFNEQRKILEDDNYKALIYKAKKLIINPYFDCILNDNNDSYKSFQLFPIIA